MNKHIYFGLTVLIFNGCATTTDPRQGGLFSYNPDAYEQRLNDRRDKVASIEKDTEIQKDKGSELTRKYNRLK